MSTLSSVIIRDTYANLPAAGIAGRLFFVSGAGTNAGHTYRDNGSTWDDVTLTSFVGDSGSGGSLGAVPGPASGDSAAGKFLSAGGAWSVPSGATSLSNLDINTHPTSPDSHNDEFESTSLNGAWAVISNTASAVSIDIKSPGNIFAQFTANQTYIISKSFSPGASATSITACVSANGPTDFQACGFLVGDGTGDAPANYIAIYVQHNTNFGVFAHWRVASGADQNVNNSGGGWTNLVAAHKIYLHLQKTAGGVWSAYFSFNGMSWFTISANIGSSFNPTISNLTVAMDSFGATTAWTASIDWIRANFLTL
jgi:hypothetical protein